MFELVLKSNFEILECNFEVLEENLRTLIKEKYDIVVTEDSVKEAKNIRAEISKGKKALEQAWRERKQELEAPIKILNDQAKKLFAVCDDATAKIDMQVNRFEEKKRELAVSLCEAYKNEICAIKNLSPSLIDVSGFTNLSYVTEKGALSSSGKQAVDTLIISKIAEISEQKQRELEAQMEVERIKQEAREELLRQQAQQNENTQEPQAKSESKENGEDKKNKSVVFSISIQMGVSTKGEYSEEMRVKVQDWVRNEIEKNPQLKQALRAIEVRRV